MAVLLNKWEGTGYRCGVKCMKCGKYASVVRFAPDLWVCASCLHDALGELDAAVLMAASAPKPMHQYQCGEDGEIG